MRSQNHDGTSRQAGQETRRATGGSPLSVTLGELLALGYLRYRKRLARQMAEESALRLEKPLDDVAPEGRVPSPENRTPEKEGSR